MEGRKVIVELTKAEARAVSAALGNALTGDYDDEIGVFVDRKAIAAARRAENKLQTARWKAVPQGGKNL